jgi:hypothetical protein
MVSSLVGVEFVQREIHLIDLVLQVCPFRLHLAMQPQDLTVDGEPVFHAPVNDEQDAIDCWSIVRFLGVKALNLFEQRRLIRQVHTCVYCLSEPDHAALHGLHHLLGLAGCTTEHEHPSVFSKLLAESLCIFLQFPVAGVEAFPSHFQLIAGAWEGFLGSGLENRQTHWEEVQRCPQRLHSGKQCEKTGVVLRDRGSTRGRRASGRASRAESFVSSSFCPGCCRWSLFRDCCQVTDVYRVTT